MEQLYTISADFRRFDNLHLGDLFGATGVYVLWDARARAKPTYIGEGQILKRLADHSRRDGRKFARPLNGYIAVIAGSTRGVHKLESQVVERLLLDVAFDTDREPAVNVHPGSGSVVRYLCDADPTLKIKVTGWDPLLPPVTARPLFKTKEIRAWLEGDDYKFDHTWRLRRLGAPVA